MSPKTRVILATAFAMALVAGAVLGMVASSRTHRPVEPDGPKRDRGDRLSLVKELNLDEQQQQQMKEIWSSFGRGGKEHFEQHRALQKQRDEAVLNLFTPEQREKYDAIEAEYRNQMVALSGERDRKFERAVEETKKILTPEQQQKYDELLKRRREEHDRGERRGGPGGGPFGGGPPMPPPQSESREVAGQAKRSG